MEEIWRPFSILTAKGRTHSSSLRRCYDASVSAGRPPVRRSNRAANRSLAGGIVGHQPLGFYRSRQFWRSSTNATSSRRDREASLGWGLRSGRKSSRVPSFQPHLLGMVYALTPRRAELREWTVGPAYPASDGVFHCDSIATAPMEYRLLWGLSPIIDRRNHNA